MKTTYKGYTVFIEQDLDVGESPLEWTTPEERGAWFVLSHSKYTLPNELDVDFDSYENWRELAEGESKTMQVYRFINWYEHGGIALSLQEHDNPSDRWDAGIAGVVIGNSIEEVSGAFNDYKMYMEGDVWSYIIEDAEGNVVDSLSNIYGYEYAEEEARAYIDNYVVNAGQAA